MAIEGNGAGAKPVISANVAAAAAAVAAATPLGATVAAAAVAADLLTKAAALTDDAALIVTGNTLAGAGQVKSPVNVISALAGELAAVVPGAKLIGDIHVTQFKALLKAFEALPKQYLPYFHGITVVPVSRSSASTQKGRADDDEELAQQLKQRLVVADLSKRTLYVSEEAFGLPMINGVPGVQLAIVAELGRLAAAKPGAIQEFARLSGWTQVVRGADGRMAEAPKPTTGAVPGEVPAGAPTRGLGPEPGEGPTLTALPGGAARQGATQRLTPAETARLRGPVDPRRAPGTAPLAGEPAAGSGPLTRGGNAPRPAGPAQPIGRAPSGPLPGGRVPTGSNPAATGGSTTGTPAPGGSPATGGPGRPAGPVPRGGTPAEARRERGILPGVEEGGDPAFAPAEADRPAGGGTPLEGVVIPFHAPGAPAHEGAAPAAETPPGDAPAAGDGARAAGDGVRTTGDGARATGGDARATGVAPDGTLSAGADAAEGGFQATGLATQEGGLPATGPATPAGGPVARGGAPEAGGFGATAAEAGALDAADAAPGEALPGGESGARAVGPAPAPGRPGAPARGGDQPARANGAPGGPGTRGGDMPARGGDVPARGGDMPARGGDMPGRGGLPARGGAAQGGDGPLRGTAARNGDGPLTRGGDGPPTRGGDAPPARGGTLGPTANGNGRGGGLSATSTPTRHGGPAGGGATTLPGGGAGPAGGPGRGAPATSAPPARGGGPGGRPGPVVAVDGGGQVALPGNQTLAFHHDPEAGFFGAPMAQLDPRTDFGEALKGFLFKPEALMKASPAKFLLLNADTRQFTPAQVKAMAQAAGVDLGKVVTELLVSGRASQSTISRIAEFHGIAADGAALKAKDQQVLAKGANVDGLVARLALDLGANGPATAKAVREAEAIAAKFEALAAKLELVRDPARVGLPEGNKVFKWIATRALALGEGRLARVDAEMSELRAQFQRLPLAAQLKVDPQMALGAGWFRFSPAERAMFKDPAQVQGLIAQAAGRVDEVGYLPQRLNASEKRALAVQTMIEAVFDPSAAGAALRAKLGAPDARANGPKRPEAAPDLAAALRELPARNGEMVLGLLDDGQKKALGDRRAAQALKEALADPALAEAIATLRAGATGSEQIRTALLKFALDAGRKEGDLVAAVKGAIEAVRSERDRFAKGLDGGALELAMTEVNRQVQEGNTAFVRRFTSASAADLEEALGPWIANALSPAEKKMLEDPDYRRHLVEDAQTLRSTGASLAEEARQFRIQTENIQQTLDFLTRPDQAFRREFEKDPVGTLMRRGIYPHLPEPIKQQLALSEGKTQLESLTKAVEQAIAPILQRQIGHQRQLENLRAAIKTVNAGNYKPILGVLDMGEAEMSRAVRTTLTSAMNHGDKELRGGIIDFL